MSDPDTLELSTPEMRALGYRVIDILVDHFQTLHDKPVTPRADRPTLEARLREPVPHVPADAEAVLDRLQRDVMGHIMHLDHPRFWAFVPSPSNFVSVMADTLASGFNVFAGTWLESSGPAQVELVTIDWLRQACGLPAGAGGLFVSGGSMANITALAVARHKRLEQPAGSRHGPRRDLAGRAVIYCSDQTHSSIDRGLRLLGFQDDQLNKIPSDAGYRLDLASLRRAVVRDRAAGRIPFCLVANAGTTNTGAIDPLPALGAFCRAEGLWLHVDGAYGAAAALCPRGRALLSGLEEADSLVLDPHKWLFQPYEIGCVLVRDAAWLRQTFHILPEYLADIEEQEGEVNFCDRGIQLTRGFRALKLWMSLQVFGLDAFVAALGHGFSLAEAAEALVRALPGWEVVTPAQMAILTFRCTPAGATEDELNRLNRLLVEAMVADGYAMISSTALRDKTVLRMCTINPRATRADVKGTIQRLESIGDRLWSRGELKTR